MSSNLARVQRVNGPETVDRDAWNRLAERSAVATVFQTWEWHRAWWDAYGDRFEDATRGIRQAGGGGGWAALLPLAIDPAGILQLAGGGMADYLDALAPAEGSLGPVRDLWTAAVNRAPTWRRAELSFLPERAALLRVVTDSGQPVWSAPPVPCPRADLRNAEVADRLRRKKSLRRHHNHFRKQSGYRVEHLESARDVEPHLDAFFEQHVARWAGTPTPSLFHADRPRAFYRALVRRMDGTGLLRFTRIALGDRPIAFHLGFVHRGTFVWYKPTFDPELARRSPGEALLKELLDRAVAERLQTFDFTVGDEAFKSRFATAAPLNRSLTVYRRRIPWLARRAGEGVKAGLKRSRLGAGVLRGLKRALGR